MTTSDEDPVALVVAQIVMNLWADFSQLWIFKDAGAQAILRAWAEGRRGGLDDYQIFAELLSVRGRIGLGGVAMGLIAGSWVGCDAAAVDVSQHGLHRAPL